jgi:hypothetical protein
MGTGAPFSERERSSLLKAVWKAAFDYAQKTFTRSCGAFKSTTKLEGY